MTFSKDDSGGWSYPVLRVPGTSMKLVAATAAAIFGVPPAVAVALRQLAEQYDQTPCYQGDSLPDGTSGYTVFLIDTGIRADRGDCTEYGVEVAMAVAWPPPHTHMDVKWRPAVRKP